MMNADVGGSSRFALIAFEDTKDQWLYYFFKQIGDFLESIPLINIPKLLYYSVTGRKHMAELTLTKSIFSIVPFCNIYRWIMTARRLNFDRVRKFCCPRTNANFIHLCNWMNHSNVQKKSFYELFVPGSHDACAYKFDMDIPVGALIAWSQCQRMSVFHQLASGVRYVDVRILDLAVDLDPAHYVPRHERTAMKLRKEYAPAPEMKALNQSHFNFMLDLQPNSNLTKSLRKRLNRMKSIREKKKINQEKRRQIANGALSPVLSATSFATYDDESDGSASSSCGYSSSSSSSSSLSNELDLNDIIDESECNEEILKVATRDTAQRIKYSNSDDLIKSGISDKKMQRKNSEANPKNFRLAPPNGGGPSPSIYSPPATPVIQGVLPLSSWSSPLPSPPYSPFQPPRSPENGGTDFSQQTQQQQQPAVLLLNNNNINATDYQILSPEHSDKKSHLRHDIDYQHLTPTPYSKQPESQLSSSIRLNTNQKQSAAGDAQPLSALCVNRSSFSAASHTSTINPQRFDASMQPALAKSLGPWDPTHPLVQRLLGPTMRHFRQARVWTSHMFLCEPLARTFADVGAFLSVEGTGSEVIMLSVKGNFPYEPTDEAIREEVFKILVENVGFDRIAPSWSCDLPLEEVRKLNLSSSLRSFVEKKGWKDAKNRKDYVNQGGKVLVMLSGESFMHLSEVFIIKGPQVEDDSWGETRQDYPEQLETNLTNWLMKTNEVVGSRAIRLAQGSVTPLGPSLLDCLCQMNPNGVVWSDLEGAAAQCKAMWLRNFSQDGKWEKLGCFNVEANGARGFVLNHDYVDTELNAFIVARNFENESAFNSVVGKNRLELNQVGRLFAFFGIYSCFKSPPNFSLEGSVSGDASVESPASHSSSSTLVNEVATVENDVLQAQANQIKMLYNAQRILRGGVVVCLAVPLLRTFHFILESISKVSSTVVANINIHLKDE